MIMKNKTMLRIAMALSARYEADYADYLAECESYRARGQRPHYCEHGTNQWTDYDNICGGCEDGFSMGDPMVRRTYALTVARHRMSDIMQLIEMTEIARRLGVSDAIDHDRIVARIDALRVA